MQALDIYKANPHWQDNRTSPILQVESYTRPLFSQVRPWLDQREILAIHGLRRTGKTILLGQLVEEYRRRHQIKNKNILFYSFESDDVLDPLPEEELKTLLDFYFLQVLNKPYSQPGERTLIVLDEIQNVNNWSKILKQFYDLNTQVKIIISGSASIFVSSESESLAGRIMEFALPTLSFAEFCALQGYSASSINSSEQLLTFTPTPYTGELSQLFNSFLLCGGFPQSAQQLRSGLPLTEIQTFIREQIIKKIIARDLKRYYRVANTNKDWLLAQILADETGQTINVKKLAKDVGYSESVLNNHLDIFEQSYLTRLLPKFNTQKSKILSGKAKLYFRSPSIVASLLAQSNLSNPNLAGRLVESYIAERLQLLYKQECYYAQDQANHEVDFYLPKSKLLLEVKTGKTIDLNFLKQVAAKFTLTPILVSLSGSELNINENIKEVPAWAL